MKLAGQWLNRGETQAICAMLTMAGHQALVVGGAVRNALLGMEVADVDIATDALPGAVALLAEAAGMRVVPTGIDHGTVTVVANGLPYEVTTFRRDLASDGRHAVVGFGASLAEDAARRDFTMNALYAQADGTVIDPLGGMPDLLARRVRFVGDASARIAEDYLRILRFFRFYATHGDPDQGPDAEGLAACAANLEGLETLSRERVGAEMRKLLAASDPAPAVGAMVSCGVLGQILPGADAEALTVLVHLESGVPPGWMRRLVALGGDDPSAALRLSRAESRDWALLRDLIGGAEGPGEMAYRHGASLVCDALLLRGAVFEADLPDLWQQAVAEGAAAQFPLAAADLMPGLQGPALGARLAELEAAWIASGFSLSRADMLG